MSVVEEETATVVVSKRKPVGGGKKAKRKKQKLTDGIPPIYPRRPPRSIIPTKPLLMTQTENKGAYKKKAGASSQQNDENMKRCEIYKNHVNNLQGNYNALRMLLWKRYLPCTATKTTHTTTRMGREKIVGEKIVGR